MDNQWTLDKTAKALGLCVLLSFRLMLFTFVFCIFGIDWAYSMHSRWFNISRKEFELIIYCSLGFLKLQAVVLFLVPYVALKIVGKGN